MPEVSPPAPDKPTTTNPDVQNVTISSQVPQQQQQQSSGPNVPTFIFRKPSSNEQFGEEHVSLVGGDGDSSRFCLNVHSIDNVCRICQCGPNTLATPTPLLMTPITSPKKRFMSSDGASPASSPQHQQPTTSTVVMIELKRSTQPDPAGSSPTRSLEKQGVPPSSSQLSPDYNLISPCVCSGSLKYVHQCCLQNWIRASNNTACELCKHPFQLRSRFKPIWKWESLPMVPGEKKRIVCSAMFHTVALACVVWSLYVLIDRTVEELTHSDLEWQFWTKIIVEAIGCMGAGILTYVWGKSYISLLVRWVTFNRSFVIIGKECPPPPDATITTSSHNNQSAHAREQELINLIN